MQIIPDDNFKNGILELTQSVKIKLIFVINIDHYIVQILRIPGGNVSVKAQRNNLDRVDDQRLNILRF
jgi:hypothetical protein